MNTLFKWKVHPNEVGHLFFFFLHLVTQIWIYFLTTFINNSSKGIKLTPRNRECTISGELVISQFIISSGVLIKIIRCMIISYRAGKEKKQINNIKRIQFGLWKAAESPQVLPNPTKEANAYKRIFTTP